MASGVAAGTAADRSRTRSAADFMPEARDLPSLCAASARCRGCDLYLHATQTVFGEGPTGARVMLVGEQPGDDEDVAGHPFVGPAGRLLDDLLEESGIGREHAWLTNAVKHFKFSEARSGKRIHETPTLLEVSACRPWLGAELELVRPDAVVLLGSTAAKSLLGRDFRVTRHRGEWQAPARYGSPRMLATWHPAAVLRGPEREDRHRKRAELLEDLRRVAASLG